MKHALTLIAVVSLTLCACASKEARTFTPTDTAAIGGAVDSAHEQIKKAEVIASGIERTGTAARSQEANTLLLTIRTAKADALSAQKALEDFKLTDSKKFEDINNEVKEKTARAAKAEAEVAGILPHLWRLRAGILVGIIAGALAYFAGPSVRSFAGAYGEFIPPGLAGAACAALVVIVACVIVGIGAVFGWL